MPADSKYKAGDSLPSPWKEFLSELESMLPEPLDLHCIGGFVICYLYGLPRPTGDIDYYSAVPANLNLIEMAGEGSALAKKYKIQLHHVAVTNLPEDHATRLTEMFPRCLRTCVSFHRTHTILSYRSSNETVRKIETTPTTFSKQRSSGPKFSARGMKENYGRISRKRNGTTTPSSCGPRFSRRQIEWAAPPGKS